jgi:hypothetical protein
VFVAKLPTSGITVELPGDFDTISVHSPVPGSRFLAESLEVRDTSMPQTLAREDPDLDLRLI